MKEKQSSRFTPDIIPFFLGKASQPFRKRPPTSREAFRTQKTAIMETEIIMINKLMSYMRLKPKALHE